MIRNASADMAVWPSLSIEGNLIAPAMIAKIDRRDAPEQSPEDYGVRKGIAIREEVATAFRVGQSHFDAFAKLDGPSQGATRRFMSGFFRETLGFHDLRESEGHVSLIASDRVPMVIVPPDESLDKRSPTLSTDRSRSPTFSLQDFLNDSEESLWGFATNGMSIRLMRDNPSLTRPAHIDANLQQMFTTEDIASFTTLWHLTHRSRFGATGAPATDCPLERWRDAGAREGEAARDRLAGQVEVALRVLGSGFLEANPTMAEELRSGEVSLKEWFNELLRLIYRLIFLMVAEDRNLLHPDSSKPYARDLYIQGYSLRALRNQCIRRATWDNHCDRYEGLKIVFRALARGEPHLALPALGGLFAEDQLPPLEKAKLRNRHFMEVLYRLSWLRSRNVQVPVNWRLMETEELGSVYETLLELQPQIGDDGKTLKFATDAAERKGNQRKTTGSYYTPASLVENLLDSTLEPVLEQTVANADDPAEALLNLNVIDPACGSGHFLLAAAHRIASRLARTRAEETATRSDFRHAVRDVVRRCIHGVDRNPMAVELTKVALWIETVEPGLPLGFLDGQIRCGDALLGVLDLEELERGIPDAAYKPLAGDEKKVAKFYELANTDEKKGHGRLDLGGGKWSLPSMPFIAGFSSLLSMPENTFEERQARENAYRSQRERKDLKQIKLSCDLYIAAFLLPKSGEVPRSDIERTVPTTQDVWLAAEEGVEREVLLNAARVSVRALAFHWPLEFPDQVLRQGGFDVVLGNPPWEVIQVMKREQSEHDLISSGKMQNLFHATQSMTGFARGSGRFKLTARGRLNSYALFSELFFNLALKRAGIIVPTGIATDANTAVFFAKLVETRRLARLVDFVNSAPLFTSVHRSFKFCLLTIGGDESEAEFAFFLTDPGQKLESERIFTLTTEQIDAVNPNSHTAPVFRSRADAELTAKIYERTPVLVDESNGKNGNPWRVEFRQGMFNMAADFELFRTAKQLESSGYVPEESDWVLQEAKSAQKNIVQERFSTPILTSEHNDIMRYVPLYEPRMMHQFNHRWASYDEQGTSISNTTVEQKNMLNWEVMPRYWVPAELVAAQLEARDWKRGWLMGWRIITNATNERTLIACIFPVAGVGNNEALIFINAKSSLIPAFYACMNSITLDYIARQKIGGTHLSFDYIRQLPILNPDFFTEHRLAFITPRVLELAYTSFGLAAFANELGHDHSPYPFEEIRRANLRAELDAFFARAYALTREELRYVLDPSDVRGSSYPSETFNVLKKNEIKKYGEYRTRRLILDAWDRMEANGEFKAMGM